MNYISRIFGTTNSFVPIRDARDLIFALNTCINDIKSTSEYSCRLIIAINNLIIALFEMDVYDRVIYFNLANEVLRNCKSRTLSDKTKLFNLIKFIKLKFDNYEHADIVLAKLGFAGPLNFISDYEVIELDDAFSPRYNLLLREMSESLKTGDYNQKYFVSMVNIKTMLEFRVNIYSMINPKLRGLRLKFTKLLFDILEFEEQMRTKYKVDTYAFRTYGGNIETDSVIPELQVKEPNGKELTYVEFGEIAILDPEEELLDLINRM